MARSGKRVCTKPGCYRTAAQGSRCAAHPAPARDRPEHHPHRELYGTQAWRKASRLYLDEHPLCVTCQAEGRVTPASCTDHIVPHDGDDALFWDRSNWQALCGPCHARKTASEVNARRVG